MRISVLATVLSGLVLSSCTSSSSVDALDVASLSPTDRQVTGSVRPIVPTTAIPSADAHAQQMAAIIDDGADLSAASMAGYADKQAPAAKAVDVAMVRPEPAPKSSRSSPHTIYSPRFKDAHPINFGPVSPRHFEVHGVDVSRWQGKIDWHKLRQQGANFAYIKATDGGDHLDPAFHRNWREAAEAGVARGAYHFFFWCRVGEQQADWFIRNVPKEKGALPPVIDVEWNAHSKACKKRPSREVVLKKMKAFMEKVERHYGQRPIIYTAPDFYEDNLRGEFKDYPFWLRSVAAHPGKVYPGRNWVIWQYSGTGLSKGHGTGIDLNVFNGDNDQWRRWLAKSTR